MTRGRNGPRQPGGGKQTAGPRHQQRSGGRAAARAGKSKADPRREDRGKPQASHRHTEAPGAKRRPAKGSGGRPPSPRSRVYPRPE